MIVIQLIRKNLLKMTTSEKTISNEIKLQRQSKFHELLEAFGVTYQRHLGIESENSYTKNNGSGMVSTTLSYDVDLVGVFEEEKVEGIKIINSTLDSGFKKQSWPVIVVTFGE